MKDSFITKLLDNIASRTVITLLGLAATGITIYAFLIEKSVELRYEIVANTNVLDFNADIGNLRVTYDSTNLKETNENLRIYTIKVINNGEKDILKEFYDDNDPLGLSINSGRIIERPEIIQTSSDYLNRNSKIQSYQFDKISFSQVILESGEFYVIKLLVIHKTDKIPEIKSFGKIAGQKSISLVNSIDVKEELSFWEKVYQGNIWMQLLRLVSYFLVGIIIIAISVAASEKIDSIRERKRRKKMISDFKNLKTYEYTRMDDAIFDRYQKSGANSFKHMLKLLNDETELNDIYTKLSEELKSKEFRRYRRIDSTTRVFYDRDDWSLINQMTNDGYLFKENSRLTINQAMTDTLKKFVEFLTDNKEFKRKRHFTPYDLESEVEIVENENEK
jgi:hypothetical protein